MTNDQPQIRSISNRVELETVYDILGKAFPVGRDFFQLRLDHDSTYDTATTWIALHGENITSTVQIFPIASRVEDAALKIGGIGSVAAVPEYRGQGHCQHILQRLTQWMEQQQYDLSLLFAVITPFYEKANWRVVPEASYELNAARVASNNNADYTIIPFEPAYSSHIADIYNQFNANRTYTAIRPASFWQDQLHWPRWKASTSLLAIRNGVVTAYGHISETKEGGTAYLEELCYLKGEEAAVVPLFHALVQHRPNAARIQASLPDDHTLAKAFTAWGAVKKTTTYAMWKVIRFQPLLAKLHAVFQKRLHNSKELAAQSIQLCFICAGQHAFFHYLNGQVAIEPDARDGIVYDHLELSQEDFVSILLQGIDESTKEELQIQVLQALFPKQNSVFYNMDKF